MFFKISDLKNFGILTRSHLCFKNSYLRHELPLVILILLIMSMANFWNFFSWIAKEFFPWRDSSKLHWWYAPFRSRPRILFIPLFWNSVFLYFLDFTISILLFFGFYYYTISFKCLDFLHFNQSKQEKV